MSYATPKLRPVQPALRRPKINYIGVPAVFKLELACMTLHQAFCEPATYGGIYLVGSATKRPDFRDIDVVCILDDVAFTELFPDVHKIDANVGYFEFDPRWLVMTVALSDWLARQVDVGKPVDFKFQPMTYANAQYSPRAGEQRYPMGMRFASPRVKQQNDA